MMIFISVSANQKSEMHQLEISPIETLLFGGSEMDGRPRSDTLNRVGGDTL